jgi:hypothetical protein
MLAGVWIRQSKNVLCIAFLDNHGERGNGASPFISNGSTHFRFERLPHLGPCLYECLSIQNYVLCMLVNANAQCKELAPAAWRADAMTLWRAFGPRVPG